MYYTYILKTQKSIYIGYSSNLRKRVEEHNKGKVRTTKKDLPVKLVYYEAYHNEEDARIREKRLKYYGRAYAQLKKRIANSLNKV